MTYCIGLTGSIGMGKSTTAQMFADEGCALWDADAAVHRLYAKGGGAVGPIAEAFPGAIKEGAVDRAELKALITQHPQILKTLDQIVHPLVTQDRAAFLAVTEADIAVCDIPLLFETGADQQMDATVVVSVDSAEQMRRLMARGSMSAAQITAILAKQMPDADKRARADHVIETHTLEHARQQVQAVLRVIRAGLADA